MHHDAVKAAQKKLDSSGLLKVGSIQTRWRDVEWKESRHQMIATGANWSGNGSIMLFPVLKALEKETAASQVLRAFGQLLFSESFDKERQKRWNEKLILPQTAQIDEFASQLKSDIPTYRKMVNKHKGAVDRLVCLHLANALIANSVSRADAKDVDIRTWAATEKFAGRKIRYSLSPLTSAYMSTEMNAMFALTFQAYADCGLDNVYETSLRRALKRLVKSLL